MNNDILRLLREAERQTLEALRTANNMTGDEANYIYSNCASALDHLRSAMRRASGQEQDGGA